MNQIAISSKGVAYFATSKPYIGLTWNADGITVKPTDRLDNGMLCLHVASNRKFEMPRALYNAFELGESNAYLYVENTDGSITIRATLRHPVFSVPESDYEAVTKIPDIHAETIESQRCGHNLKATCLLKRAMPYVSLLTVTLALNKDNPFLMVTPGDATKKHNNYDDVEMFYGANVDLFCAGTMTYNIKTSEFTIPSSFMRFVNAQPGGTLRATYSLAEQVLLITPNKVEEPIEAEESCPAKPEESTCAEGVEESEKINALTKELEERTAECKLMERKIADLQSQLVQTQKQMADGLLKLAQQFQPNSVIQPTDGIEDFRF